jgi:LuxR family maltose regulon positive regulatory protein
MSSPLLATKLFIPPLRPNRVSRPRLLQKLNDGVHQGTRLILISAPAGFGKTTLAVEWVQERGLPVAWLSLDDSDNDLTRLWQYIVAAFQLLEPGIGQDLLSALQASQSPSLESLITLLINDLASFAKPLLLVMDDYHLLNVEAIQRSVNFFLDHLPPNIYMAILTRADPPLHLAYRRGRGELCEIRAVDLRFTGDEINHFLVDTMKLNLALSDINALEDRTEGWIAGLQMAAIAAQGLSDSHSFITAFKGDDRYIADYLVEEVLQRQSEETRQFLLRTSILERLNPDLCDSIMGHGGSEAILNQLDSANLFILPLDNRRQWFRYHHLFAQLLRKNLSEALSPEGISALYLNASEWHLEQGYPIEAVEYALKSDDLEKAAQLIERVMPQLFTSSELTTVIHWAEILPKQILAHYPTLCVGLAWAANATNHLELCTMLVGLAEKQAGMTVHEFLELDEDKRKQVPPEILGALLELCVQRARLSLDLGDLSTFSDQYKLILPYLTAEYDSLPFIFNPPSQLRPPMVYMVARVQELQGDIISAASGYKMASEAGQEANNIHIIALSLGHLGELQMVMGNLTDAEATFQNALKIAEEQRGQVSAFFGVAQVGLGNLAYERNQLLSARQQLEQGLVLGRLWNNWETLMPGYLGLAQCYLAQGNPAEAVNKLNELRNYERLNVDLISAYVDAWQAQISLRLEMIAEAENWAHKAGYSLIGELKPASFEHSLILGRLLIAKEEYAHAKKFLEGQMASAASNGLWGLWIKIGVLLALTLSFLNEHNAAMDTLESLLAFAQTSGHIRTFIDEGEPMAALLQEFLTNQKYGSFAAQLLTEFPPQQRINPHPLPQTSYLVEPLSSREIEILQLLSTGASNAEIAEKATITLNTTKKHLTSIYGKLGVSNRLQAVERARQLNLLE